MLKIDNSLLEDVGLAGMPEADKNSFLKHIYETLEMRVGIRLADQMSNEQLDEFERYFEAKDDAGAFKWLETNFPNYKDIVQEEFDKLKAEIAQSAPQILAAAPSQGVPQPQLDPASPQQPVYDQPAPQAAVQAPPQYQPAPTYQAAPAPDAPAYQPAPMPAPPDPAQYAQPQPDPMQPPLPPQAPAPDPQQMPPPPPSYPAQQPPAGPAAQ